MTPITCFAGKNVALFGLGGSGLVTARALLAGEARVTAWDDGEAGRAKAVAAGIEVADLREADFTPFDALVLSPGVPLTHPAPHWAAVMARAAGVEIIGDIELFCRERAKIAPKSPFVAITGTNGKSTTTALLTHLLREAGRDVAMGGNIGTAILDLPPPAIDRVHVIECSSFQIDLAPSLNPSIGILTNITPDHLDRHGSMENYAAIKARLVQAADFAVVGVDDTFSREVAASLRNVCLVSASRALDDGIHYASNQLWRVSPSPHSSWGEGGGPPDEGQPEPGGVSRASAKTAENPCTPHPAFGHLLPVKDGAKGELIADLSGIATLRGAHNGQNAAAAVAAALHLGLAPVEIARALKTFPGLKHRMEQVARLGKVIFINDSKATNADSTHKAMLSFNDMFLILGGKPKDGGIESLRPLFPKIRKAYLIGAAAAEFAATLGSVPHDISGTLKAATKAAAHDAAASDAPEPVVLLSPACASYDQFANFEVRGEHFRALVQQLTVPQEPKP